MEVGLQKRGGGGRMIIPDEIGQAASGGMHGIGVACASDVS